jgi:membrane protease YdiL (CAAX protease family)
MRLMVGLSHFTTFIVAGLGTVWLFYRGNRFRAGDWRDYLGLRRFPGGTMIGLAILLMLVSLPFVLYAYTINKALPLPESFRLMEQQTTEMIKGLLRMDNGWELLANLTIIALLPAIGEELVFRGVLQQQLMRRMANPWLALVVSAAIFSFIHFQFEGFLPRLLLGLLLGWLYWQTRNFWVPVIAHFFNNALQVGGQYLYGRELSTVDLEQDIEVPWYYAVLSLFMIWAVVRLIRQNTAIGSGQRDETQASDQ